MMNGLRREIAGDIEGMHVNLQEDMSGMDERIRYLNTQSESSLQASRDSFEAVATRIEQRVDGSERKTARKMQDLAQTVSNAAVGTQALMDEQSSRMNSRMVRTSQPCIAIAQPRAPSGRIRVSPMHGPRTRAQPYVARQGGVKTIKFCTTLCREA